MKNGFPAIAVALGTFLALLAAALGQDEAFRAHMWIAFTVLGIATILLFRRVEYAPGGSALVPEDTSGYLDGVVRYGVIAALFWGIAGFLVGIIIASELAWPILNLERPSNGLFCC